MEKEKYQELEMEVIRFECEDVITYSCTSFYCPIYGEDEVEG